MKPARESYFSKLIGFEKRLTFNVTAQVNGDGQLVGTAETTINRADFDLFIPSVPFVADVSEEVTLSLSFVAAAS